MWRRVTNVYALAGHTGPVTSAAFSPDGALIVTAGDDGTAKVWDVATGTELHTLAGHTAGVTSAAFSPDGALVVTASDDNTAKVWDVATGDEVYTLAGHTGPVTSAAFSPDGALVVTASDDNTARTWYANLDDLLAATEHLVQRNPPLLTPEERRQLWVGVLRSERTRARRPAGRIDTRLSVNYNTPQVGSYFRTGSPRRTASPHRLVVTLEPC